MYAAGLGGGGADVWWRECDVKCRTGMVQCATIQSPTMAKASIHDALARQLDLLNLLEPHGLGQTALELIQKLREQGYKALQKRTVERDLVRLDGRYGVCRAVEAGRSDKEKPYRWKRLALRAVPMPDVEMADALSLVLAEELLRQLAPVSLLKVLEPKLAKAQSRLTTEQKNCLAQWKDRVCYVPPGLPFLPPRINERYLRLVKEAILEERQIEVQYSAREASKPSEQTLHPLALVQHGSIAYLVATAFDYGEPRLYALHRISSVTATKEPAERPKGFSLDSFLVAGGMQFGEGPQIRLKAVVPTTLANYLQESPLSPEQKLKPIDKGHYRFEVSVKDSWQLGFWILSQGEEIVVVGPRTVRRSIQDGLRRALAAYRKPVGSKGDTVRDWFRG